MKTEMYPVNFSKANHKLLGDGKKIKDLPIYTDGEVVCSCWYIPFFKRLKLIFTGRVYLVVMGTSHPPLWIDTELFGDKNESI